MAADLNVNIYIIWLSFYKDKNVQTEIEIWVGPWENLHYGKIADIQIIAKFCTGQLTNDWFVMSHTIKMQHTINCIPFSKYCQFVVIANVITVQANNIMS